MTHFRHWLILWIIALAAMPARAAEPNIIRVMTFNLWHGGDAGGHPLEQTAAVVRAAKADIVGLQETHGYPPKEPRPNRAKELAELLGWSYFDQGERTGIISRWKIVDHTPRKWGVIVEQPNGERLFMFNAHLAHAPYQPYQLLKIPYADSPFLAGEAEAIAAARQARGAQVERLLGEMRVAAISGLPVFLTGDFNEPSHLDWTERAVKAGLAPLKVEWPSSKAVVNARFKDAFRSVNADEVAQPGKTWTPIKADRDLTERHDRIDMIFFTGRGLRVTTAEVIGEGSEHADIVVTPYPSDHRAVVATFERTSPDANSQSSAQ